MKEGIIKCPNCDQLFDTSVDVQLKPAHESNYLWLFDNGHGGIIDGEYQTAG
tara:strand:+ start:182 stop:337 length:156 start_codon:yes stop_codon:yes gene_type:complete